MKKNLKNIEANEKIVFARLKELINLLKTKYSLSTQDIIHLTQEEILIPTSIFTKKLSILETLTKYLKENLKLKYSKIGKILNRDERNIWATYDRASKKYSQEFRVVESPYFIPISIFQNDLSVLENITIYLKDNLELSYHNIAILLERDDRTIWTMYNRGKKKLK